MNKTAQNLTSELLYLFNTGKLHHAYRTWGAHAEDGGVQFSVWAPNAAAVSVVGDFNGWKGENLEILENSGTWTGFSANARIGDRYKFDILGSDGKHVLKADPFAFSSELRPATASVISDISYDWNDGEWMLARDTAKMFRSPLNIYEVHLGSWKRHPREDAFYSYRELAETLIPYALEMGYTHLELLPVMEHPLDASWGYQVTGYYAATSRYGTPADLKYFIDCCHKAGLGVILDWVPGHFCPDEHGLACFDGSMLFECEIHPDWGTYKFDFSRGQVRSFLLSNAMFWLDEFHADGLRVDGVSSMLYLNFGISDSRKKKFNKNGEEANLDAVSFLREMNRMVGCEIPGAFTCAEESSAWPMVTMPPDKGGLGFHFKWNMGWMNDTLSYMQTDFPWRGDAHNKMTFSMSYAYSENYILPLSHDEVVHGKLSLLGRMPGDIEGKFAGLRLLAMYQMTHPGKKLSFMGNELAPFIEWREYEELEWFMLQYGSHSAYSHYTAVLNDLYRREPALWLNDSDWSGFKWIDADNREQNVLTYIRIADAGCEADAGDDTENVTEKDAKRCTSDSLIVILNMGAQSYERFRIGVPEAGTYELLLNTDDAEFGGSGRYLNRTIKTDKRPMHGMDNSIEISLPGVCGMIISGKK